MLKLLGYKQIINIKRQNFSIKIQKDFYRVKQQIVIDSALKNNSSIRSNMTQLSNMRYQQQKYKEMYEEDDNYMHRSAPQIQKVINEQQQQNSQKSYVLNFSNILNHHNYLDQTDEINYSNRLNYSNDFQNKIYQTQIPDISDFQADQQGQDEYAYRYKEDDIFDRIEQLNFHNFIDQTQGPNYYNQEFQEINQNNQNGYFISHSQSYPMYKNLGQKDSFNNLLDLDLNFQNQHSNPSRYMQPQTDRIINSYDISNQQNPNYNKKSSSNNKQSHSLQKLKYPIYTNKNKMILNGQSNYGKILGYDNKQRMNKKVEEMIRERKYKKNKEYQPFSCYLKQRNILQQILPINKLPIDKTVKQSNQEKEQNSMKDHTISKQIQLLNINKHLMKNMNKQNLLKKIDKLINFNDSKRRFNKHVHEYRSIKVKNNIKNNRKYFNRGKRIDQYKQQINNKQKNQQTKQTVQENFIKRQIMNKNRDNKNTKVNKQDIEVNNQCRKQIKCRFKRGVKGNSVKQYPNILYLNLNQQYLNLNQINLQISNNIKTQQTQHINNGVNKDNKVDELQGRISLNQDQDKGELKEEFNTYKIENQTKQIRSKQKKKEKRSFQTMKMFKRSSVNYNNNKQSIANNNQQSIVNNHKSIVNNEQSLINNSQLIKSNSNKSNDENKKNNSRQIRQGRAQFIKRQTQQQKLDRQNNKSSQFKYIDLSSSLLIKLSHQFTPQSYQSFIRLNKLYKYSLNIIRLINSQSKLISSQSKLINSNSQSKPYSPYYSQQINDNTNTNHNNNTNQQNKLNPHLNFSYQNQYSTFNSIKQCQTKLIQNLKNIQNQSKQVSIQINYLNNLKTHLLNQNNLFNSSSSGISLSSSIINSSSEINNSNSDTNLLILNNYQNKGITRIIQQKSKLIQNNFNLWDQIGFQS